jgi:Amt family ammonium transporter
VFVLSYITFAIIKATLGLRVDADDEDAGLDIAEHGMYGYPEQFIPDAELAGYGALPRKGGEAPPAVAQKTKRTEEVPA